MAAQAALRDPVLSNRISALIMDVTRARSMISEPGRHVDQAPQAWVAGVNWSWKWRPARNIGKSVFSDGFHQRPGGADIGQACRIDADEFLRNWPAPRSCQSQHAVPPDKLVLLDGPVESAWPRRRQRFVEARAGWLWRRVLPGETFETLQVAADRGGRRGAESFAANRCASSRLQVWSQVPMSPALL
jgi:hypothetical protein